MQTSLANKLSERAGCELLGREELSRSIRLHHLESIRVAGDMQPLHRMGRDEAASPLTGENFAFLHQLPDMRNGHA